MQTDHKKCVWRLMAALAMAAWLLAACGAAAETGEGVPAMRDTSTASTVTEAPEETGEEVAEETPVVRGADESMADYLKRVIAAEADALAAEKAEELASVPAFVAGEIGLTQEDELACRALMEQLEEVWAAYAEEGADEQALRQAENELCRQMAEIDPKGYVAQGYAGLYAMLAQQDDPWLGYFAGQKGAYRAGSEKAEDGYYDVMMAMGSFRVPTSLLQIGQMPLCVTAHITGSFTEQFDKALVEDEASLDKLIAMGESRYEEIEYFTVSVDEVFWGDAAVGDELILLLSSAEMREEWREGGQWQLFLYPRTDPAGQVNHQGETQTAYGASIHGCYRVTESGVASASMLLDFRQYNGLSPEELALTALRLAEKYGPMPPLE